MIMCNIPTIAGGSMNEITVKKQLRASDIAIENHLPLIFLNQCAGANLPQQLPFSMPPALISKTSRAFGRWRTTLHCCFS